MPQLDKIIAAMRGNPRNIAFSDLYQVCEYYFGEPRQSGTSHIVFRTPWPGDPG